MASRRFPLGRIVRGLLWTAIICAVVVVLGLTMIAGAGGASDQIKAGIESFFSRTFGMHAQIGTLSRMEFYPDLLIDLEDLAMRPGKDDDAAITIQKLGVGMRFWDMALSRGLLTGFNVEGLSAAPEALTPQKLEIKTLSIAPPAENAASVIEENWHLAGRGTYGGRPFRLAAQAESRQVGRGLTVHRLMKGATFRIEAGDILAEGNMDRPRFAAGFILKPLTLSAGSQKAQGSLSVTEGWEGWEIDGDLDGGGTQMAVDLSLREDRSGSKDLSGTLWFPQLIAADFAPDGAFFALIEALSPLLEGAKLHGMELASTLQGIKDGIMKLGPDCRAASIEIRAGVAQSPVCQPIATP